MLKRIANGRTDLVFDWVESGRDPRASDEQGTPLLRWCAYYGDVSAIRFLLGKGESLGALGENFGLNGAAFHGHWQLCQFCLEQGANPDWAAPVTGETALHAATSANRAGAEQVVRVLLAEGANPNVRTVPDQETGSFMRDCRSKGETPLHRAAAFGTAETIQMLLTAGAIVDAQDAAGDSPLSWASWHRRPSEILRLLLFPPHKIHPDADWTGDHGAGLGGMDRQLVGRPTVDDE